MTQGEEAKRAAEPAKHEEEPDNKRAKTEDQDAPSKEDTAYDNFSDEEGEDTTFHKTKTHKPSKKQQAEGAEQQEQQEGGGVAEDMKGQLTQEGLPEDVLEVGRITFFFRPKVNMDKPSSVDDVQRFHILLEPFATNSAAVQKILQKTADGKEGAEEQAGEGSVVAAGSKARLITIGKKRLPSPHKHERFFAFVSAVGTVEELTSGLGEQRYTTKTQGERVQGAAVVAGSGVYSTSMHGKDKTVLAYELELPLQPGECQEELNIDTQGALAISVKNPDTKSEAGVPHAGPPPEYSEAQKQLFGGRRWVGALDPAMLDHTGTELLFIGAKKDVKEAAGEGAAEVLVHLQESHMEAAGVKGDVAKQAEAGSGKGSAAPATEQLVKELASSVGPAPEVGAPATTGDWEK